MEKRLQLHELFLTFCDNVYFQEPENLKMRYPSIIYHPDVEDRKFASNGTYNLTDGYQVTVIDEDPDSLIRKQLRQMPLCVFVRSFRTEGLNHFIYTLYY